VSANRNMKFAKYIASIMITIKTLAANIIFKIKINAYTLYRSTNAIAPPVFLQAD
jgi:hypothetical protein